MPGQTKEPDLTLGSIADRYWKTYAEYSPTTATVRGEHGFDDLLRRFDDVWLDDMGSRFRSLASEASQIDQTLLSTQDRISIQLLIHECGVWDTDIEHRFLVGAVDPYLGPHTRSSRIPGRIRSPRQTKPTLFSGAIRRSVTTSGTLCVSIE